MTDHKTLTDNQLKSAVQKRRPVINALNDALPDLYTQRREAKQALWDTINSSIQLNSLTDRHKVYLATLAAAAAENALQDTRAKLKAETADQVAQKRELKARQNRRKAAKQAIIDSYVKRQERYAERGQIDPRNVLPPKPADMQLVPRKGLMEVISEMLTINKPKPTDEAAS